MRSRADLVAVLACAAVAGWICGSVSANTSGFVIDAALELPKGMEDDPLPCFAPSPAEGCVNDQDVVRLTPVADVEAACSSELLDGSSDPAAVSEQVAECVNAVRTDAQAFAGLYPCDAAEFITAFEGVKRTPLKTRSDDGPGELQPLDRSAAGHAKAMSADDFLGHTDLSWDGLSDRVKGAGWTSYPLGESIAAGFGSVQAAVLGWMCTEDNRQMIMACGFDTLGAGAARNAQGKWFFTLNFGCKSEDFTCLCGTAATDEDPEFSFQERPLPEPGTGIAPQSTPAVPEIDVAQSDPGDVTDAPCFEGTEDCKVNVNSVVIQSQQSVDIDRDCPTTRLLESGLTMGEISNQVETCINAYRQSPDLFQDVLPCAYTFRDEVTRPSRTPLKSSRQTGPDPVQPLDISAVKHSRDMGELNFFSHDSLDGRKFSDRITAEGWTGFPIGENIAAGYRDVRSAVLGWVCSPGHRKNLMSCGYDTMGTGVAFAPTSKFQMYYTQNFGCTAPNGQCQCGLAAPVPGTQALPSPPPSPSFATAPSPSPSLSPSPSPSPPLIDTPLVPSPPTRRFGSPSPVPDFGFPPTSPSPIAPTPAPIAEEEDGEEPYVFGPFFFFDDKSSASGMSGTSGDRAQASSFSRTSSGDGASGAIERLRSRRSTDGAREPIVELFDIISGDEELSSLLEEADVRGVFRRRDKRRGGSRFEIFTQTSADATESAADNRTSDAVAGDPLIQLDPAKGRPLCLDDPNIEACGGTGLPPEESMIAEQACPDTPITGFNVSGVEVANQIKTCVNAFRTNPDAFAMLLPCEFSFRTETLMPRRGPLNAENVTDKNATVPLDRAAMSHSLDMSSSGFMFGHYGSDGLKLDGRLAAQNFTGFPLGEIIAARYGSVRELVTGLVCYERHREILTSCAFDSMGAGVAIDDFSPLDTYVTLTFACAEPDGNCRCTDPVSSPPTVPPNAIASVTDVGDIEGPIVCAASSRSGAVAGGSIMANFTSTSPNTTTTEVSSFGAEMFILGVTVFGKDCRAATSDSQVEIAVLFDIPQPIFPPQLLVALLEDGTQGEVSAPAPVQGRDNTAWSATVNVPDAYIGNVTIQLVTPDDIFPTLIYQKLDRDALVSTAVAILLDESEECP